MLEIAIGVIITLAAAGAAVFLILLALNIVLFFKLRSMFDRGVPFAGY